MEHLHVHETLTPIEAALVAHRGQLLGFIRSKVADADLAEDILQDALLKALRSSESLRDEDRLLPWMRSIINNAIVDSYRARASRTKRQEPMGELDFPEESPEEEAQLCECFKSLIPALKPQYGELVLAELDDEPSAATASRLGISANNLKVRRHRARQALRQRLEDTCRTCAEHGCLDCTCAPEHGL